jgi:hypothetical protein
MTLQEFKSWFDGFTENIEKIPSQKQWKRIQERVAEIDGVTITERVYVDRYVQPYRWAYPYPPYTPMWMSGVSCSNVGVGTGISTMSFNSVDAMGTVGRIEAQSLLGLGNG